MFNNIKLLSCIAVVAAFMVQAGYGLKERIVFGKLPVLDFNIVDRFVIFPYW